MEQGLLVVAVLDPGPCPHEVAGPEVPVKIVGEIDPARLSTEQVDTTMFLARLPLMVERIVNRTGESMWGICHMKSNGRN